jgi:hypothetical protein
MNQTSLPKLVLHSKRSTAVTYTTRTGAGSEALFTINDTTGELIITSGWGNWSYRWDARGFGPQTLTEFLADGDVYYIVDKLLRARQTVWSASATVKALQTVIVETRLRHGRSQRENRLEPEDMVDGRLPSRLSSQFDEDGLPLTFWSDGSPSEQIHYLTEGSARRLWIRLGRLAGLDTFEIPNPTRFDELFLHIFEAGEYITTEPWMFHRTEETQESKDLREIVVPGLIEVCRNEVGGGKIDGNLSESSI